MVYFTLLAFEVMVKRITQTSLEVMVIHYLYFNWKYGNTNVHYSLKLKWNDNSLSLVRNMVKPYTNKVNQSKLWFHIEIDKLW